MHDPSNAQAPFDLVSLQLRQCFERIFEIEDLPDDADFFELGGDSMAAVQLLVEIEDRLGVRLPPTFLIDHPTLAGLTGAIGRRTHDQFTGTIVPIKRSGSRPPIFMTHGHSGDLWPALNLASHLAEDQPLYGIRPDFGRPRFRRLGALAKHHARALVEEHPRRDYQLLGYSFGGVLAYEIARRLEARGLRVSLLGIIDARPDSGTTMRRHRRPDHRERWARLKDRFHGDGLLATLSWSGRWLRNRYRERRQAQSPARTATAVTPAGESDGSVSLFEQRAVNAFFEHVPGTYAGDIVYFETRQNAGLRQSGAVREWGEYTSGEVEVVPVEGDHLSIGSEPGIRQVAAWLTHR